MFTKEDHPTLTFQLSPKALQFLGEYQEFNAIVDGKMCAGINPAPEPTDEELDPGPNGGPPLRLPPVEGNRDPLVFHRAAFSLVGKTAHFPEVDPWNDSSDDYAKKMVDSGHWEQIAPGFRDNIYPMLRDHDILTWAFSEDGIGGCDGKPGMDGGNTTTGFLIKASGDFPTLAYAMCRYVPSGVFPLAEVLTNQKYSQGRHSGKKGRLIYIHRLKHQTDGSESSPVIKRVGRG